MPLKRNSHLFFDISNSWTKWSTGTTSHLGAIRRIPTPDLSQSWLRNLWKSHTGKTVVLSSVVPNQTAIFQKVWPSELLLSLNHTTIRGITIDYPHPESIGADRLANAVAAAHLYACPAVVVDFGTAVTFDILSRKGCYLGGVIAPGLNAMTDYLHERTALLPLISLQEPGRMIGKSTEEAMRVGAVVGYRGLVREILKRVMDEMGERKVTVAATGGHAGLIAGAMKEIQHVNPKLTLEGLRLTAKLHAER